MKQYAKTGDFCPNGACADCGKLQDDQQQNIIKFGKTPQGAQRYRRRTRKRTFTASAPEHELLEILALLAEGKRIVGDADDRKSMNCLAHNLVL